MAKWTLAVLLLLSSSGSFGFLKCIMKLVIKSIMKSLVRFSHRGITTGRGGTALLTACNNCGALTEVIPLDPRSRCSDGAFYCRRCWEQHSCVPPPEKTWILPPMGCHKCGLIGSQSWALTAFDPWNVCSDLKFYCFNRWSKAPPRKGIRWPPMWPRPTTKYETWCKWAIVTDFAFPQQAGPITGLSVELQKRLQQATIEVVNGIDATCSGDCLVEKLSNGIQPAAVVIMQITNNWFFKCCPTTSQIRRFSSHCRIITTLRRTIMRWIWRRFVALHMLLWPQPTFSACNCVIHIRFEFYLQWSQWMGAPMSLNSESVCKKHVNVAQTGRSAFSVSLLAHCHTLVWSMSEAEACKAVEYFLEKKEHRTCQVAFCLLLLTKRFSADV